MTVSCVTWLLVWLQFWTLPSSKQREHTYNLHWTAFCCGEWLVSMEAPKRRTDNLTWLQAPLINSSSDKATALNTSVVAEGLGGFFFLYLSFFFIILKTFRVVVAKSINLWPFVPLQLGTLNLSARTHTDEYVRLLPFNNHLFLSQPPPFSLSCYPLTPSRREGRLLW